MREIRTPNGADTNPRYEHSDGWSICAYKKPECTTGRAVGKSPAQLISLSQPQRSDERRFRSTDEQGRTSNV